MKNKVIEFYMEFNKLNALGNSAYVASSNANDRGLRQIKAKDVSICDQKITMKTDFNTSSFLKKFSPVIKSKKGEELVDSNKLSVAIAFMRVEFKEEEKTVYFPLVTIDVTKEKQKIYENKNGSHSINIDFEETQVSYSREVINYFFDMKTEEGGKETNDFLATGLEDLIPFEKRNLKDLIDHVYGFFNGSKYDENLFNIDFPSFNTDNSSVFMFFNVNESIKASKEFEEMKNEENPLVDEYLNFTEPNNVKFDSNEIFWAGSLTRDYPLGKGQSIVLQQNQANQRLVPVIGAPGTGKSTLFLSVIANEVTKRAFSNIFENKDYSNLMLITSTANKAIENVYLSLKKGFKHGFCLVGGNNENKEMSKLECLEFIEIIREKEFSQKNSNRLKGNIKRIKSFIELRKANYEEIQTSKKILNDNKISKYSDLVWLKAKMDKELNEIGADSLIQEIELIKSGLKRIEVLKGDKYESITSFFEAMENEIIPKIEIVDIKLSKIGFIGRTMGKDSKILNENFNLSLEEYHIYKETITSLFDKKSLLPTMRRVLGMIKLLAVIDSFIVKYSQNEKLFNNFIKSSSYGEYFRTNLFNINYKMYLYCYNYLQEKMLQNKQEVIKALGYIVADNQYKYFADNYRFNAESYDTFLRMLSLAYPVTTSTLAAISNSFKEIYPAKSATYNLVLSDESGMICANDILPTLRRAKRAIIVGDPKQLPPIVSLGEIFLAKLKASVDSQFWDKYSPSSVSAYHRSAGTEVGGYLASGRGVVLDEHRRCSPKIANLFIEIGKYEGLEVRTKASTRAPFKKIGSELMFFDVKNADISGSGNVNITELEKISAILNRLEKAGYDLKKDVGIITPYKRQESQLISAFGERVGNSKDLAKIGTVHKFQGAEFKVIIMSTVASRDKDSLSFINSSPAMTIVSISRAIESLIVVGDYDKLTSHNSDNFIGEMARSIKSAGLYVNLKK